MADIEFKLEGSLGFEGNKSRHQDRTNRIWAFAFGHKIKSGWDSGQIEELNDVYPMMRSAQARSSGLLVAIPRNGGGEIGIADFNLELFRFKDKYRPTSFGIHIIKYEGGQFPGSRKIEFKGVSRVSVQSTIYTPFWVNGNPMGFSSADPSFDVHHFSYADYEIS